MGTKYEEGQEYRLTCTGDQWTSDYKGTAFTVRFEGPDRLRMVEEDGSFSVPMISGYEYEVTPLDEPTPTELHYLYPDGTEFSVFPNRDGEIVFVQETFDSFVSRLGAKPAPKKYEDGLYVDKDGDEVLWHKGRLWTGWESYPDTYENLYAPLTLKEDQ